jgi:hypothetical protein
MQKNKALENKGINHNNCSSAFDNVNIKGDNFKIFSWSEDRALTNFFDVTDGFLSASSLAFWFGQNESLVSVC